MLDPFELMAVLESLGCLAHFSLTNAIMLVVFSLKNSVFCPQPSNFQGVCGIPLLLYVFLALWTSPGNGSVCEDELTTQIYRPVDFFQSEAWGNQTGREAIYPNFAANMVNEAIRALRAGNTPDEVFLKLTKRRLELALAMSSGDNDNLDRIRAFGQLRWEEGLYPVAEMDGYSEIARLDTRRGSYFINHGISQDVLSRFREILAERGAAHADDQVRRPLQDPWASHRRWHFQLRNYYQTQSGKNIPGTEWYVETIDLGQNGNIEMLIAVHPKALESKVIVTEVMTVAERLTRSQNPEDFMRVLYGLFNATPTHRGSSLIGKAFAMALYFYSFGKKLPPLSDGFDVFAMVEPDFDTFNERYRPKFFSPAL